MSPDDSRSWIDLLVTYHWIVWSVTAAPFTGFRIMQGYKRRQVYRTGAKPPAHVLDAGCFVITSILAAYCLAVHFHRLDHEIALAGFLVAGASTAILKTAFAMAEARGGKFATALDGEMFTDDVTRIKTLIGTVAGVEVKPSRRRDDGKPVEHDRRAR